VKLEIQGEEAIWTMREIDDVNLARVKALLDDGLSVREIHDETGIARSTVGRLKKKIEAEEAAAAKAEAATKDTPWDTNL
jgi:DNA invertase Pin-like site-specific DNA recombinase